MSRYTRANRGKPKGWASQMRLKFIDDALAELGYIRREMVADYFGCDLSLASMDLTAYRSLSGTVEKSTIDGKPCYRTVPEWASVLNSTPARQQAWEFIDTDAPNGREWFTEMRRNYIADHPHASAREVSAYFGIGEAQAETELRQAEASRYNPTRAKVWEVFSSTN